VAAKLVARIARPVAGSGASSPPPASLSPARVAGDPGTEELTDREGEILRLVARGASNREISEALFITEGTVKNHVSNILSKFGLRDRTQAALYAREHGLA
jgi:DNA-binding NarL/FixJ family response regulator